MREGLFILDVSFVFTVDGIIKSQCFVGRELKRVNIHLLHCTR